MKKFLHRLLIYTLLILLVHIALGYFFEKVTVGKETENGGYHPRERWSDFHDLKNNSINLLFLGSSHCYRSFNPLIFDTLLQVNSFNLGSAIQTPITSYFVLKEALQTQQPGHVVLEVYFRTFYDASNRQLRSANYNFEFMKSKNTKLDFLIHSYKKDIPKALLPTFSFRRGFDYLTKGYKVKNSKDKYISKGYVERSDSLSSKRQYEIIPYSFKEGETNINQTEFLQKIIALCKEKEIELFLVSTPITKKMMKTILNYNEVFNYFNEIAKENRLMYIDYNMIDLKLKDSTHFYDFQHLNKIGAEIISKDLGSRIKKR